MSVNEFEEVNRMTEQNWNPEFLFGPYKVRAIMKNTGDVVSNAGLTSRIRRKLRREVGDEDETDSYTYINNPFTGRDEFYFKSTAILMRWKLSSLDELDKPDHEDMLSEYFEKIQKHVELKNVDD